MKTPLTILTDSGTLNWGTLLVGFDQGMVTNVDAISFAIDWLVKHPEEANEAIVGLAAANDASDQTIRSLIANAAESKSSFTDADDAAYRLELDKWRYARLRCLRESALPVQTKLDELQRIHAEFGYPVDMAGCSKYGPSEYAVRQGFAIEQPDAPLAAMERVLDELETRLSIRPK
jgi:hypothetical protein